MQELIKKFVELGLEAQSRMVNFLTDVLDKARMDEEERKKVMEDLNQKMTDSKEKSERLLKDLLDKVPNPIIFARQKDLEELQQRVDQLEQRLADLEAK
jgi:polyhydroxyalkanoate synthesis regulator phasin